MKALRLLALVLLLGLSFAQKSGGGVGGRPYAPSPPPPMSPGPAPVYPVPAPTPGPVFVYPYPGGGGSLGAAPVLVFFGLALVAFLMVRGLRQAGEGGPQASVGRLRLALLVRPEVQRALRRLAEEADTTTAKGLADLLDEVTLLLLREAPAWRFASYEAREGTEEEVLGRFDAWMLEDRSTYQETFRHFEGKKVEAAYAPKVEPGGRYLVASLLLAVRGGLPPQAPLDRERAREVLLAFAGSTPFTLLAFHLAWTPEKEGEGLTEEELLLLFPNLEKL
uniref:Hypothetical conserved protein n=1 Tax=uncultured Deinococcota bacterium TaxID=179882 RepID=H5SAB0_9DEIN|nr:hypothetical conserved protein [uncultured Deinococcota bacterium]